MYISRQTPSRMPGAAVRHLISCTCRWLYKGPGTIAEPKQEKGDGMVRKLTAESIEVEDTFKRGFASNRGLLSIGSLS